MLKILVTAKLQGMLGSMFRRMRKGGSRGVGTKILISIFALYVIGALLFMSGTIFLLIAEPMAAAGFDWLYFAMAAVIAVMLCFVGSVFATQSQLFSAKDNELLLSMPIPPGTILASRLISLLLINYMYSMMIMIPAYVVHVMLFGFALLPAVMFTIGALLMPLISMSLSCVLGWLIGLITSRMRGKNLITIVLFVGFFTAYMWFFMNLQSNITALIANGAEVAATIKSFLPPMYYFGSAVATTNWMHLLIMAAACVLPFTLVWYVLSKSFTTIITTKKGNTRIVYREKAMKAGSSLSALFKKEMTHFVTSTMYMFNCGIGAAMQLIYAGALLIKGPSIMGMLVNFPGAEDMGTPLSVGILSFLAIMICTTAPSISLEGSSLWILKSSPVSYMQVFWSKLLVNICIGVPGSLIASGVTCFVSKTPLTDSLLIFLIPLLLVLYQAAFGLVANLHMPRFDWTNETAVVKRGGSVMATVFGGMAIVFAPILLYLFLLSDVMTLMQFLWMCVALLTVAITVLMLHLKVAGKKLYDAL